MNRVKQQQETRWQRNLLVLGPSIFLGLTLLISGTGKVPGQTEFVDILLQSFWTPTIAYLAATFIPWVEIVLGALLLLGVFTRIAAALCLPLTIAFMINNGWAVSQGMTQFPTCGHCFGVWEELLGAMTPIQALSFDVVLFCLALIILLFHPSRFWNFRPWFIKGETEEFK